MIRIIMAAGLAGLYPISRESLARGPAFFAAEYLEANFVRIMATVSTTVCEMLPFEPKRDKAWLESQFGEVEGGLRPKDAMKPILLRLHRLHKIYSAARSALVSCILEQLFGLELLRRMILEFERNKVDVNHRETFATVARELLKGETKHVMDIMGITAMSPILWKGLGRTIEDQKKLALEFGQKKSMFATFMCSVNSKELLRLCQFKLSARLLYEKIEHYAFSHPERSEWHLASRDLPILMTADIFEWQDPFFSSVDRVSFQLLDSPEIYLSAQDAISCYFAPDVFLRQEDFTHPPPMSSELIARKKASKRSIELEGIYATSLGDLHWKKGYKDSDERAALQAVFNEIFNVKKMLALSTRSGGLGLRSVARHSVAGYAASLLATAPLCKDIDGNYDEDQGAALHQVNLALPPADHFPVPAPHPLRQQELSRALDRVVIAQLAAPGPGREAYRAHFQLLQQEGAGAWLHAVPNDALGLHVVTPLFRTMVRLRLRLPIADSDMACPLCDGTSDSFGDHARVCPCGGDRVKRHNQLRNILAGRARAAGLQPEVEKPNLLPPRPELHGGTEDGSLPRGNGCRPADVWIANWNLHGPAAFDVAVTSGLRQGHLAASAADGMDYEVRKCRHLDTLQACATEGLQFIPLVVEACGGGWGPTALKTWRSLSAAIAARTSDSRQQLCGTAAPATGPEPCVAPGECQGNHAAT